MVGNDREGGETRLSSYVWSGGNGPAIAALPDVRGGIPFAAICACALVIYSGRSDVTNVWRTRSGAGVSGTVPVGV
jgi:hypothetical protein